MPAGDILGNKLHQSVSSPATVHPPTDEDEMSEKHELWMREAVIVQLGLLAGIAALLMSDSDPKILDLSLKQIDSLEARM